MAPTEIIRDLKTHVTKALMNILLLAVFGGLVAFFTAYLSADNSLAARTVVFSEHDKSPAAHVDQFKEASQYIKTVGMKVYQNDNELSRQAAVDQQFKETIAQQEERFNRLDTKIDGLTRLIIDRLPNNH